MYLGLPALSYRLVPRAGSPACPGLAALGPEKYTGRTALGTKMCPGHAAPGTRGMDILTSSNGGYGRAGLGLSLDIVGQGRGQGGEQSNPDPQGGGSKGQRHRRDQAGGQR